MSRQAYAGKRPIRIYSKFRFTIFIILLMVIAFVLGGFMFNADASGMEEPQYESVVIRAGDTIWNIAETYGPAEGDTRVYVRKICNANKIDPGKIYPGQTILVPVYADSQKA